MDEARQHLVERLGAVARGDRSALRDIYDLTSAKLFGVCLRILSEREEAEDVLQEVYLTIWNKAGGFDPSRASPITWLATIARNRSIDRLRSIGPRRFDRPVDDAIEIADTAPDAVALLELSDDRRRLDDCLKSLDVRARGIIVAAFYGGNTYEELAFAQGMPLGTLKSVVRRGLQRLRGCLEG